MLLTPTVAATAVARGSLAPDESSRNSSEILNERDAHGMTIPNKIEMTGISSSELASHLDSIRAVILRSEERLLRREAELGIMERDAKGCLEEAAERRKRDLESIERDWGRDEIQI